MSRLRARLAQDARRLMTAPFAAVIGVLSMLSFVNFMVDSPTSITRQIHALVSPLDFVYMTVYGLGGALFLYGMARTKARPEFIGLLGIAAGALTQAIAFVGAFGAAATLTCIQLGAFAVAAGIRASYVWRGYVITAIRPAKDAANEH